MVGENLAGPSPRLWIRIVEHFSQDLNDVGLAGSRRSVGQDVQHPTSNFHVGIRRHGKHPIPDVAVIPFKGGSASNIINQWISNGEGNVKSVKKAALGRSPVRVTPVVPVIKPGAFDVRLVQLAGDDIDSFSFLGELNIAEDQVKAAVSLALREEGWTTDVRWGHVHGIDINATRSGRRLIVEAKGEGTRSAMRVN